MRSRGAFGVDLRTRGQLSIDVVQEKSTARLWLTNSRGIQLLQGAPSSSWSPNAQGGLLVLHRKAKSRSDLTAGENLSAFTKSDRSKRALIRNPCAA